MRWNGVDNRSPVTGGRAVGEGEVEQGIGISKYGEKVGKMYGGNKG